MKRVAALETELRAVVRRLLEPLAAGDPFDFVQDFAAPYPILAFWREPFMGRPVEHPMVGDSWLTAFQHWSYLMHHDDTRGQEGTEMMHKYISVILDDRRKNPGDDIPTQLLTQEVGGRMLSEEEIHDTLFLLFSAGIETSAAALGNMLHFLAHHREARRALVEDPAIIPSAVEELLRHVGPSQCVRRTATTDTEVAGCPVKKGESVVIHWGAANLDEEAFERADEFDPTRSPNPPPRLRQGRPQVPGPPLRPARAARRARGGPRRRARLRDRGARGGAGVEGGHRPRAEVPPGAQGRCVVRTPASPAKAVLGAPRALSRWLSYVSAAVLAALVLLVVVDVAVRNVGSGGGVEGTIDYVSVGQCAVVFLVLARSEELGAHVRTPILTSRLPERMAALLRGTALVLVSLVMAWLTWATWGRAMTSLSTFEVMPGVASVPVWPVRLLIPLGSALLTLELARTGLRQLLSLRTVRPEVPGADQDHRQVHHES